MFFFRKSIKKEFEELFALLDNTKLHEDDKRSAWELFFAGEQPLALDTISTQLYEFDIKITPDVLNKIQTISQRLKIKETAYDYLKELVV
jgi:hypothetical protein